MDGADEVRAKKNLNKIDGGDMLFIQQNMAPDGPVRDILNGKNGQVQTAPAEDSQSQGAGYKQQRQWTTKRI